MLILRNFETMTGKYLTFTLDTALYAAEINQVLEVLDYEPPQTLPCPDPVIAGIIWSRNRSISVINLHRKFGSTDRQPTKQSKIIVFELTDPVKKTVLYIGAVTDSVLEVLEIEDSQLEPPPETGRRTAADFITGIARKDNLFILILDFSKLFSPDDLTKIISLADNEKNTA